MWQWLSTSREYFLVGNRRRPVTDRDGNPITYGEALATYTGREKLLKNELERLVQVEVASKRCTPALAQLHQPPRCGCTPSGHG